MITVAIKILSKFICFVAKDLVKDENSILSYLPKTITIRPVHQTLSHEIAEGQDKLKNVIACK